MNIAFYVSAKATRLRKIIEQGNSDLLASTRLIFSDDAENGYLQDMIASRSVEYHCLNYKNIEKTEGKSKNLIMSDAMLAKMQEHNIDYCFSFGAHIITGEILKAYENKIINFHPSILPMFPGLRAIDQAVEAGSNLLGNTAHFINAGIDTGPVIMQSVLSHKVFEAGGYDAVLDQQLVMINQIFKWLKADRLKVINNKVTITRADYDTAAFFPSLEP
jgi:phosphoribosylglycinamide formyltransferase 1